MFLTACIGQSLFLPTGFAANPTFAIIFHILAVMTLYTWKETGKNKYLYFLGLIIGFGVQVHAMMSVHTLTAFILFLMKKEKPWKPFLWFIPLIFLPCLPYLSFYNFYTVETLTSTTKNLSIFTPILFPSRTWLISFHIITSFKPYLAGPVILLLLSLLYKIWFKKVYPLSSSSINLFIVIIPAVCIPGFAAGLPWYTYHIPHF